MNHKAENKTLDENFILSAKAPTIREGVMMAKVIWKVMKTVSGMVPTKEPLSTPKRKFWPNPPMNEFMLVTPADIPTVLNARL